MPLLFQNKTFRRVTVRALVCLDESLDIQYFSLFPFMSNKTTKNNEKTSRIYPESNLFYVFEPYKNCNLT